MSSGRKSSARNRNRSRRKAPTSHRGEWNTNLVCLQGKSFEVDDNWVNIRATMDTRAAGHVIPAEMFPRVKLDRTSAKQRNSFAAK